MPWRGVGSNTAQQLLEEAGVRRRHVALCEGLEEVISHAGEGDV